MICPGVCMCVCKVCGAHIGNHWQCFASATECTLLHHLLVVILAFPVYILIMLLLGSWQLLEKLCLNCSQSACAIWKVERWQHAITQELGRTMFTCGFTTYQQAWAVALVTSATAAATALLNETYAMQSRMNTQLQRSETTVLRDLPQLSALMPPCITHIPAALYVFAKRGFT